MNVVLWKLKATFFLKYPVSSTPFFWIWWSEYICYIKGNTSQKRMVFLHKKCQKMNPAFRLVFLIWKKGYQKRNSVFLLVILIWKKGYQKRNLAFLLVFLIFKKWVLNSNGNGTLKKSCPLESSDFGRNGKECYGDLYFHQA